MVSSKYFDYFRNLGYENIKFRKPLIVKIEHLQKGSRSKIEAECSNCNKRKNVIYIDYIKITNDNTSKYFCKDCKFVKIKETNLKKYGVENPLQSEFIKEKVKKTNIERYGYENAMKNKGVKEKSQKIKIENGSVIPRELVSDYELYRRKVDCLTIINKSILYENWDGYDYYDNEYIRDNKEFRISPTIDHKVSCFYGYINNISPEEISDIKNLCITKMCINASKNSKTEINFKEIKKSS
jgi:hypothetical protein